MLIFWRCPFYTGVSLEKLYFTCYPVSLYRTNIFKVSAKNVVDWSLWGWNRQASSCSQNLNKCPPHYPHKVLYTFGFKVWNALHLYVWWMYIKWDTVLSPYYPFRLLSFVQYSFQVIKTVNCLGRKLFLLLWPLHSQIRYRVTCKSLTLQIIEILKFIVFHCQSLRNRWLQSSVTSYI